jgi:Uma2 family endonuclease
MSELKIDHDLDFMDRSKLKKEKIDNKIYLMAPPNRGHRRVQRNISNIFENYFRRSNKKCEALSEAELYIDEKNYLIPDVMIFCYENDRENKEDIPVIVIEVLSNSTRKQDLGVKMEKYAQLGIKEYWIITWETTAIDIYMLNKDSRYYLYKSYVQYTPEYIEKAKLFIEEIEITEEFSPVSIPELKMRLEDVFYFVT